MSVLHDLVCAKCGFIHHDVMVEIPLDGVSCSCGGDLEIIYLKAPAITGTETGARWFRPGYNVQLGRSFETWQDEQKYAEKHGLVTMGPDEYRRTENAAHDPEPSLAGIEEAMEAAYHETFVEKRVIQHQKVDKDQCIVVSS